MADIKKVFIYLFIFLALPVISIPVKASALSSPTDSIVSLPNQPTSKPRGKKEKSLLAHTDGCMNFGEPAGFGQIGLGVRAGICALFDPNNSIGYGIGADLRVKINKRWKLEGYTDYFKTTITPHLGYHIDLRFGVDAFYYLKIRDRKPTSTTFPFILGGLGYENNNIRSYAINTAKYQGWTPWFNIGLGEQFKLTPHWDFVIELLYDVPLAQHPLSYTYAREDKPDGLNVKYAPGGSKGGIFAIVSLTYTFGKVK